MELRQLRYFVEVAEREHVSEAAEHLHVAQSAISRQIARLEEELGVTLFEKIGRNIQLTPIGRIFLVHAKTAIKSLGTLSLRGRSGFPLPNTARLPRPLRPSIS